MKPAQRSAIPIVARSVSMLRPTVWGNHDPPLLFHILFDPFAEALLMKGFTTRKPFTPTSVPE